MAKKILTSKDKVPLRVMLGVKNDWINRFTNADGSAQDLTGWSYFCQLRDKPGGKLLGTLSFDLTNLATGLVPMTISAANASLIGEGTGTFDVVRWEDADHTNRLHSYGGDVEFILLSTEFPEE